MTTNPPKSAAQSVLWHLDPDGGAHILIVWRDGCGCSLYVDPDILAVFRTNADTPTA